MPVADGNGQKSRPVLSWACRREGRSDFDARSVLPIREHDKMAITPLVAFFNIPILLFLRPIRAAIKRFSLPFIQHRRGLIGQGWGYSTNFSMMWSAPIMGIRRTSTSSRTLGSASSMKRTFCFFQSPKRIRRPPVLSTHRFFFSCWWPRRPHCPLVIMGFGFFPSEYPEFCPRGSLVRFPSYI